MSALLGLDPSPLRLGWGAVDLDTGAPIACGTTHLAKTDDGWLDARSIRQALRDLTIDVDAHMSNDWDVSVVYIEAAYHGPSVKTTIRIAEAMGQTVQAVNRRWPHAIIQRLDPTAWRRLCGLKGTASKADVIEHALSLVAAAGWTEARAHQLATEQDAADGLIIARAGWHSNNEIVDGQGAAA